MTLTDFGTPLLFSCLMEYLLLWKRYILVFDHILPLLCWCISCSCEDYVKYYVVDMIQAVLARFAYPFGFYWLKCSAFRWTRTSANGTYMDTVLDFVYPRNVKMWKKDTRSLIYWTKTWGCSFAGDNFPISYRLHLLYCLIPGMHWSATFACGNIHILEY